MIIYHPLNFTSYSLSTYTYAHTLHTILLSLSLSFLSLSISFPNHLSPFPLSLPPRVILVTRHSPFQPPLVFALVTSMRNKLSQMVPYLPPFPFTLLYTIPSPTLQVTPHTAKKGYWQSFDCFCLYSWIFNTRSCCWKFISNDRNNYKEN